MSNYWKSCVEEAFSDLGIVATPEQTSAMVSWVQGAHENYGMAHGHECIPNPLQQENDRLIKRLKLEQEKVQCKECNGRGAITLVGPHHWSTSRCDKCGGEGRHAR